MSFLKKLGKGIGKAFKAIGKGVSSVATIGAGLAGKLIGSAINPAGAAGGLVGKLAQGAFSAPLPSLAVRQSAQDAVMGTVNNTLDKVGSKLGTMGGKVLQNATGSWFKRNIAWIIPTGIAVLVGIVFLIISVFKRRR
jgi:hypothetical protein